MTPYAPPTSTAPNRASAAQPRLHRRMRGWLALLALAAGLTLATDPARAQPTVGSTVRDTLALGWGASVALPEGDWRVAATPVLARKGFSWEVIVLRDARPQARIPLLVVRHSRENVSWGSLPCPEASPAEGAPWFMLDWHGSAPNGTVNRCSRVWPIGDYAQWRSRIVPGSAWWKELGGLDLEPAQSANGFLLVELMLQEHQRRGIRVEAFVRPPAGRTPAQFREAVLAGKGGTEAEMLSTWISVYMASTQLSFLNLSPRPIAALGWPQPGSTASRPVETGKPAASASSATAAPAAAGKTPPSNPVPATAGGTLPGGAGSPVPATAPGTSPPAASPPLAGPTALVLEQQNRDLQRQLEQMRQTLAQLQAATVAATATKPAAVAAADRPFTPRPPSPQRKALVIGNDRYTDVPALANAVADAEAMARTLQAVGFTVTKHLNLTEKRFKQALRDFRMQVQGGDEVIVYYAGHGVQLGAANYLLPVDIRADHEEQVKDEAIPLQRILDDLNERKAKFSLAVIDACRDNPFQSKGRSIGGRGLAPTSAASGQMVMYSAGAGQQALDRLGPNDPERNGLFTRVLLREMTRPGQSVDRVLRSVRNEVVRLARSVGHEQTPALYDQAIGEFFFAP
jgi:hypothetical protein